MQGAVDNASLYPGMGAAGMMPPGMAGFMPGGARPATGYPGASLGWPQGGGAGDRFDRIVEGTLQPDKNDPSFTVPVDMTSAGLLLQKTLNGPQVIGQLDTQGNYRLVNGQGGNMFVDGALSIRIQQGENPFIAALRDAEQQRATLGSEIPVIRATLTNHGIDGRGVKVGILDPYQNMLGGGEKPEADSQVSNDDPNRAWRLENHTYTVGAVINNPVWGVAPGAQVVDAGFRMTEEPGTDRDNVTAYLQTKIKGYSQIFNNTSRQLYNLMQQGDPTLRVLSLTWGSTLVKRALVTLAELSEKDEDGAFKWPKLREAILGNARFGSVDDKVQAVLNFVHWVDNHPVVQQAYGRYVEATRQLTTHGITLLVAANNDHGAIDSTATLPPGAEFCDLARSPYVIAVAASDTNMTPGQRADDTIAPFSSRGDGIQWNPAFAAPGQGIRIGRQYGQYAKNLVISGTSYSTPFSAAVVSLMIQRNPNLNFFQIKSILQGTATPIQATVAETGAGVLTPERAVWASA